MSPMPPLPPRGIFNNNTWVQKKTDGSDGRLILSQNNGFYKTNLGTVSIVDIDSNYEERVSGGKRKTRRSRRRKSKSRKNCSSRRKKTRLFRR